MEDFYRWKEGNTFQYASSLAATWIWAPALLVSSLQAYNNGLPGFLMFLVPNFLTLILFSYFANKVRSKVEGFTMVDALQNVDARQKNLHVVMSCVLLVLSTCSQVVGIYTAMSYLIDSKLIDCVIISSLALLLVWRGGIKASIITDSIKYIVLVICAVIILFSSSGEINFIGHSGSSVSTIWWTFGLTTCLGLLSAPYIDSTLWQRAFSIPKDKIIKTYTLASCLFVVIPLIFGYIGFIGAHEYKGFLQHVMLIAILGALISTLDSNLIAIAGYANKEFKFSEKMSRLLMLMVLVIACVIFIFDIFNITQLFLVYNTVRVCMVLPTIFIILDCYHRQRLFYSSLAACLICPVMFILTGDAIYTILALAITLIGYRFNRCI